MARISRSILLPEPVGTICELWTEFERTPRCAVDVVEARLRWRAEVLTFEPDGDGTRVTLRIDFEPHGSDAWLPHGIEGTLEGFRSFLTERAVSEAGRTGTD